MLISPWLSISRLVDSHSQVDLPEQEIDNSVCVMTKRGCLRRRTEGCLQLAVRMHCATFCKTATLANRQDPFDTS